MSGKTDEMIDVIMAIENIGNELKKARQHELCQIGDVCTLLEDIAGSLELIALAMQGVYK